MNDGGKYSDLILAALAEDIGNGDHSSLSVIPPAAQGTMVLKIKEEGTLAGMAVAEAIIQMLDQAAIFKAFKTDGELVVPGDIAFEVTAHVHALLKGERLILNCMQRMSGIATLTARYVEQLKGYRSRILDTRKTTPNFRLLEKEAVRIGGALNHRFGLYDMIMLKDNHIDFAGGVISAIAKADAYVQSKGLDIKIEVEARTLKDVEDICAVGKGKVMRIMLDNFSPSIISTALLLIDGQFETEASGGIHLGNIVSYAATGVDYISVGALIHHAVSIDLSLKAVKSSEHA